MDWVFYIRSGQRHHPMATPLKKQKAFVNADQFVFEFKSPSLKEKNKYEEVIDEMMHSEICTKYPELAPIFTQSFRNNKEKRQAILAALDKNRGLFTRINRKIGTKEALTKSQEIEELIVMLREYVEVGEVEKKLYGEVMTPISLVEEMLDGLPQEVWTDPTLKWLDPANGCGIFPAVIIKRLMAGLADYEPNEDKRYKHIMENMIYVCELQAKNMFLFLCAFDPKDKYSLNIYTGNFLEEGFDRHAQEIWGVKEFDVIVGNPPYQLQREGFDKTQPLWHTFIEKAIKTLKEHGTLCTVHPSGWRNCTGIFKETQKLILERDLLNLNIQDEKEGLTQFGAETRFDHYCLVNSKPAGKTKIKTKTELKIMDVSKLEFIPNGMFEEFLKLIAKDGEEKVEILYSRSAYGTDKPHIKKEKTETALHPCVYTVKSGDKPSFWFSETNQNGHFHTKKLIWSNFRISSAGTILDLKGEYGLTQFAYGLVDTTENLPKIKKAFDSIRFRKLMEAGAVGELSINRKIIGLFKKDFWKEFI